MEREFEGRSVAEAAIKACEALGKTRSTLKYRLISETGENLQRRVVIGVTVDPNAEHAAAHGVLSARIKHETIQTTSEPSLLSEKAPGLGQNTEDSARTTQQKLPWRRRGHDEERAAGRRRSSADGSRRRKPAYKKDNASFKNDNGHADKVGEQQSSGSIEHLLEEIMEPQTDIGRAEEAEKTTGIQPTLVATQKALSSVRDILRFAELDAHVNCVAESDEEIKLEIVGPQARCLLGKKGEVLSALQFIVNRMGFAGEDQQQQIILIDIEGYRASRLKALGKLARRLAEQALAQRKAVRLTPMSAYDRRVFHLTLQKMEGIVTRSEGIGEMRHLLIIPAELF